MNSRNCEGVGGRYIWIGDVEWNGIG